MIMLHSALLILFIGSSVYGQTNAGQDSPAQVPGENQPAATTQATRNEAQRTPIEVKPGPPVIKQKDLWDATGYFHPFVRMPKYILQDQKAIWTSPFHTAKSDIKFWVIFGGVTGALIASDKHIAKALPNSPTQVSISNWGSRFGSAYFLIPAGAGFYFIGTAHHDDHLRETGLLAFEALIDTQLVAEAIKIPTDRARPFQGNGNGGFGDGPSRWSSGFPSGHAIGTWSMASIVAHQYPHPRIVPVIAYALAGIVVASRVGARQHFPGDVMAGSTMGWFIGDYVYGRRHNLELDQKKTAAQKILDHISIGAAAQP